MSVQPGDIYTRPSREEIARRVNGGKPHREPDPEPDALARYARALRGRLRVLGWTAADLAEKSGLTAHVTGRAVNGTGVDLGTAERLAVLTGTDLATMVGPYQCATCAGSPPAGFRCMECGTETAVPAGRPA